MVITLILIALTIAIVIVVFNLIRNRKFVLKEFENASVVVAGKKGSGKDLLFQFVIKKRKKAYANMPYGDNVEVRDISTLSVAPNTYDSFINGKVMKVENQFPDSVDYFLSDGGIYLPSQYHGLLDKKYPSLPIFYALSRQLNDMRIHVNTQNFNRLWDKLREQADSYFKCLYAHVLFKRLVIQRVRFYSKYESAVNNVLPFPKHGRGEEIQAQYLTYCAQNGIIKDMYIIYLLPKKHYDTRYFQKVLYKEKTTD